MRPVSSPEASATPAGASLVSARPWVEASGSPGAPAVKGDPQVSYYKLANGQMAFPRGSLATDIHGQPIDLGQVQEVYDTLGNRVWEHGKGSTPAAVGTEEPSQEVLADGLYARLIGRHIPTPASQTVRIRPGQVQQAAEDAIKAIEKVHPVGRVGRIPVVTHKSLQQLGARGYYKQIPILAHIAVAFDGPWPRLTTVHEYGHFLDNSGFFGSSGYASSNPKFLSEWRQAVMNSQAVKDLNAAKASSGRITQRGGTQVFKLNPRRLSYLLNERELFARSYAQYIATRSQDPGLIDELNRSLSHTGSTISREQWEANDFMPIADVFDKLLQNKGSQP